MKLTKKEVGKLQAIHLLLWDMIEKAKCHELRGRLEKAWEALPCSSRSGR